MITDDCPVITHSHFVSVRNDFVVGMGPGGSVTDHAYIDFSKNTFSGLGQSGDVGVGGTYTCAHNVLRLNFDKATFDHNTEILTWNGVEYVRVR